LDARPLLRAYGNWHAGIRLTILLKPHDKQEADQEYYVLASRHGEKLAFELTHINNKK
jgi:hypothetical protein